MLKTDDSKKIRKMLLIRVLLLPFAVSVVVYGTIIYFFTAYSSRQVRNELVRIATDHRNLINQFLTDKTTILGLIATSHSWNELSDKANMEKIFRNLQTHSKAFFDLGLFDADGNHVTYAGPYDLAGKNYAQAQWFKSVQDEEVFISDEFLGYRKIPHFIIAVRRRQTDKTWYLRATIDTYYFNDLVENIRIGSTGEAYIVNQNGILQTRRRSGGLIMDLDNDATFDRQPQPENSVHLTKGSFISRYIYTSVPIEHTRWRLIVRQKMGDAYAPLTYAIAISLALLALSGTGVAVTSFLMATAMATRLKLADMEKREMRTQLIIAGKMAEIGEMSTGIAHEINNPLQVMKSELAMIDSVTHDIEPILATHSNDQLDLLKDSTAEIGLQINRCSKITQGLLNFARKNENTLTPVTLQTFIPQMVSMVDQRARVENIRIVQRIDTELPEIISDSGQLQQVFLNLLNNAIYALRGRANAEIRIQARQENSSIVIGVADNGCGFKPDEIEKAFVPFFTTKPVGQGTGLGLSTVYGIIKGLGGDITLTSQPNAGSNFTIQLPLEPFQQPTKAVER